MRAPCAPDREVAKESSAPAPPTDHAFPTLTPAQVERLAARGRGRPLERGEVLLRAGERPTHSFVVVSGQIEGRPTSAAGAAPLVTMVPGMFTGEVTMLSRGRAIAELRVGEAGEVIETTGGDLLSLIQTDGELSEVIMRACVLRRVTLIANRSGDTVVLGSTHCQGTLRVREFLTRNGYPYTWVDLDRDAGVQELLDRFQVTPRTSP